MLTAMLLNAKVYTPSTVPMVHLQDARCYVCNPDGILSQAACDTIDAIFREVEDSTGVQAIIAVLGEIDPADCHEFSRLLGEENGVGQEGRDNGIVVVLSTAERDISFSTGYGVEGVITDALSKRIQVRDMVPYFSHDDWDGGMVAGMRSLGSCLMNPELAEGYDDGSEGEKGILAFFLVAFLGPVGLAILYYRRKTRCPECGQHKLRMTGSELLYKTAKGKKTRYTYTCKNCGHQHYRDIYTSYYDGGGTGGSIGGGFGSGGFGGGAIGGSFGGGHFGGGGAHTKF